MNRKKIALIIVAASLLLATFAFVAIEAAVEGNFATIDCIKAHLLKYEPTNGVSVDVNGDGKLSVTDLLQLQKASNAYSEYVKTNADTAELPKLFLYELDADRIVAIKNGDAVGVYATQEEALNALIGEGTYDIEELKPTSDGKLFAYGSVTEHIYKNGICTVCGAEDPDGFNLNGLNVLCLGDSVTVGQGLTADTRWTNILASKYGWNLTNRSEGGVSMTSYYYTTNGQNDISIAKKAEILKSMETKPDMIILWGGHNDTSYRCSPLGTWEDETTDSFKGALKHVANLAREYAPDATLFVLTPLWNHENPATLKVPEGTTDTNWMFVDAIYEGAKEYGWIPVNMDLCGINPFNKTEVLQDNIHPNEAGAMKIVEYLSKELASYGQNSKKDTIIVNKSEVSLKTDETETLKAVRSHRSGISMSEFAWTSSDSSVATVDANGMITAVAPGNAIITATAANGISTDINVSVTLPPIIITMQPSDGEAKMGERYCVTVEAEGEDLNYTWYIRNKGSTAWSKSSVTDNTYDDVMTDTRADREVYCVITDAYGNSITTNTVRLILLPD